MKHTRQKLKRAVKTVVSDEFVKKIQELGFKKENAEALFETKIDWTAMKSNDTIYCTQVGCEFSTQMFDGCLKNHCKNVHQWGQYPCVDPNCEYVGYSQANVNKHRKLHNRVFDSVFEYKCPYPDCESSFTRTGLLETHLNIHRNELKNCEFCQFRYSHKHDYKDHLSHHFRIRDHKCDKCDKTFMSAKQLTIHYQSHEGIKYTCTLCKKSTVFNTKQTAQKHFGKAHSDVSQHSNWSIAEQYFIKE